MSTALSQPVCVRRWVPVVGNHEYYDGAELGRFLDQTWGGKVWPNGTESESALFKKGTAGEGTSEGAVEEEGGRSTATHALGAMLSRGNQHGLGQFGSTPSNTSRFFSTDFGLIHFVALDLNVRCFPGAGSPRAVACVM